MNTSKNVNAAAVLNTLSPASITALEAHFREAILSTLTATLGSPAAIVASVDADEEVAPVKRGPGRPRKNPEAVVEAPAAVKRGPGRPRKVAEEAPAKRGPGRPAGSKNKAKDVGPSGRAKAAKAAAKASEPTPRAKAKDGRTASQVCRDFDEKYTAKHGADAPAAEVVAHCAKLGLEIAPSLVYNVRQNVKKAAAAAAKTSKKAKKTAK